MSSFVHMEVASYHQRHKVVLFFYGSSIFVEGLSGSQVDKWMEHAGYEVIFSKLLPFFVLLYAAMPHGTLQTIFLFCQPFPLKSSNRGFIGRLED